MNSLRVESNSTSRIVHQEIRMTTTLFLVFVALMAAVVVALIARSPRCDGFLFQGAGIAGPSLVLKLPRIRTSQKPIFRTS